MHESYQLMIERLPQQIMSVYVMQAASQDWTPEVLTEDIASHALVSVSLQCKQVT
jgi:hypothetical protein